MIALTQPFCLRYYLISPHLTFGSHPKFSEEIPGSSKNINSRNPKVIDSNTRKRLGCSSRAPFPMVLKETNNQKHPCLFKHLSHPDTANKGTIGFSLNKRNKMIMNYALIWRVKRILDLSVSRNVVLLQNQRKSVKRKFLKYPYDYNKCLTRVWS